MPPHIYLFLVPLAIAEAAFVGHWQVGRHVKYKNEGSPRMMLSPEDHGKHGEVIPNESQMDRRHWLQQASSAAALLTSLSIQSPEAQAIDVSSIPAVAATTTSTYLDPSQAKITDKVFFDVRISRQDGTFYVRDDLPDTPENRVFLGRLTMGLFGQNAPRHVERFKSYIDPTTVMDPLDDNPLPSYSRSVFASLDQATGLLTAGKIPSLEPTMVNGSPALRYGGRLLPSSLWIDTPPPPTSSRSSSSSSLPFRISHTSRGLLTHRQLETLPTFGITTRSDTRVLDGTWTVFGTILWDESAQAFFDICRDLPTYSVDTMTVGMSSTTSRADADNDNDNVSNPSLVEESARLVFTAQRNFFRQTAKALGDTRLDKVYEGKLLRRVEVTRVGYL